MLPRHVNRRSDELQQTALGMLGLLRLRHKSGASAPLRRACLQAIAQADAVRGNAARPVSAPTLCLCKRRANAPLR